LVAAESSSTGSTLNTLVADEPPRPQLGGPGSSKEPAAPTQQELHLNDARQLAKENPLAVANIVKGWVNGEAA